MPYKWPSHTDFALWDLDVLQKEENPEIAGIEYQQGTLAGYELREYLLEKWHHTCAYCGRTDTPLQVEHITPRSRGGTDRVSNLTWACVPCNRRKGNRPAEDCLKCKPEVLARIKRQAKAPLKDAAAVNSTRWELSGALRPRDYQSNADREEGRSLTAPYATSPRLIGWTPRASGPALRSISTSRGSGRF